MSDDPEIVEYLRRVLDRDPHNTVVRLQLATALVEDDPRAALDQAQRVLVAEPTDELALRIAARAASRAGEEATAQGYRRLIESLGTSQGAAPDNPVPVPVEAERADRPGDRRGADAPDEFDRFLREVLAEDARRRVTLDDVGGLDAVKQRLETSFLGPLRNPDLRAAFGSTLRGGLLLYGPPGCGKTFLARAVAGELGARFVSIGLHEVLDMWLGNSEKNLHAVFDQARALAPCVLFLDEVDALGQKRSHLAHSAGRNVVVQLLTELDSLASDNDGVFVLAATNAPWDLDPALRRPGRLDRTLLVLPPDAGARAAILGYHLRDKPVDDAVDLDTVVARTDRFSGADLALLCDSAAELALSDSMAAGAVQPITTAHLRRSLESSRASTVAWFEVARSHAVFANTDGEYDELLSWMRDHGLG